MIGIVIAIISAIFMTGMEIALKKSYKELDPSVAFFFDMLFGLILWIPLGFIFDARINSIIECIPYAIISAILSEALVFYALSKGNLSITTVLISTYPIYTLLFSMIINSERLNYLQIILILVTLVGTILTSISSDFKLKNIKNIVVLIPLFTAVAVGLSDTLTKGIINKTSSFDFLVAIALVQIPVSILYLIITKEKMMLIIKNVKNGIVEYKYSILGSLLNVLGTGCLLVSFNYTYASIASPLTALYTPFVLIYSIFVLKEKSNKINYIGIILALIGAFGIMITGN